MVISMKSNELHGKVFTVLREQEIYDGKINYILKKAFSIEGTQYVCFASSLSDNEKLYSIIFDINENIHSFNIADWNFNIDDYLLRYLENGYDIHEMSSDTHYGVWCQIDESRDEIEYKNGLQSYLHYCIQNNINEKFMKNFHKQVNIMDLYLEKNQNYKIIASTDVGKNSVVLGYNEKNPSPYVTWSTDPNREYGYSSGHYFVTLESAFKDYKKRTKECLESHFRFEKNKLNIKDKDTKGAER